VVVLAVWLFPGGLWLVAVAFGGVSYDLGCGCQASGAKRGHVLICALAVGLTTNCAWAAAPAVSVCVVWLHSRTYGTATPQPHACAARKQFAGCDVRRWGNSCMKCCPAGRTSACVVRPGSSQSCKSSVPAHRVGGASPARSQLHKGMRPVSSGTSQHACACMSAASSPKVVRGVPVPAHCSVRHYPLWFPLWVS